MENHPSDGSLVLRAARIQFQHGDLTGARDLLVGPSIASFPLADRVAAEQLLADIAVKEGQPDMAKAARVRARMLGRLIQDGIPRTQNP